MKFKSTVEIFYMAMMLRWERTAPEDGKQGLLDGVDERNTQISRMVYILRKIAAGQEDKVYKTLSIRSARKDVQSYISRHPTWMKAPKELSDGWYFEGCTSLEQKQMIVQGLTKLGLSSAFVACIDEFVAGRSVTPCIPSEDEQDELIKYTDEQNSRRNIVSLI